MELRAKFKEKDKGRASLGKHKWCGKDPEVEEALEQWFMAVLKKGVRISRPSIEVQSRGVRTETRQDKFHGYEWLATMLEKQEQYKVQVRS